MWALRPCGSTPLASQPTTAPVRANGAPGGKPKSCRRSLVPSAPPAMFVRCAPCVLVYGCRGISPSTPQSPSLTPIRTLSHHSSPGSCHQSPPCFSTAPCPHGHHRWRATPWPQTHQGPVMGTLFPIFRQVQDNYRFGRKRHTDLASDHKDPNPATLALRLLWFINRVTIWLTSP
jgi:hypothetical protein